MKSILGDSLQLKTISRLGRYIPRVNRLTKISFESEEDAKKILRKKSELPNSLVKIFPDQTPYQQKRYRFLKNELI